MQIKKQPPLIEICVFGLEMLTWFVCMFGPIALVGRVTWLALLGALVSIALDIILRSGRICALMPWLELALSEHGHGLYRIELAS